MGGNRLPVFARKPAPIQVSYPGYPNTTGLKTIDYCLTDEARNPPGAEQFFTERLVRLAGTSQCYMPTDEDIGIGPVPCTKTWHVTFASLNTAPDIPRR